MVMMAPTLRQIGFAGYSTRRWELQEPSKGIIVCICCCATRSGIGGVGADGDGVMGMLMVVLVRIAGGRGMPSARLCWRKNAWHKCTKMLLGYDRRRQELALYMGTTGIADEDVVEGYRMQVR